MLEVTSLGSGSGGNALLIRTGDATLLVDCGVGIRRLTQGLGALGLDMPSIDLVLVTHEHGDHVRELPRLVAAGKPILATPGTLLASRIPPGACNEMRPLRPMSLCSIEIIAIPVSHDAAEPCGFLIRTGLGSVTVLTDLGSPSPAAVEAIAESRLIVLEANHDETMLSRGPYPLHLKRRILSDSGHLSNAACAELLVSALRTTQATPTVWLAHLSRTNNRPELARRTVAQRLSRSHLALEVEALPPHSFCRTWSPETARPGTAQLSLEF